MLAPSIPWHRSTRNFACSPDRFETGGQTHFGGEERPRYDRKALLPLKLLPRVLATAGLLPYHTWHCGSGSWWRSDEAGAPCSTRNEAPGFRRFNDQSRPFCVAFTSVPPSWSRNTRLRLADKPYVLASLSTMMPVEPPGAAIAVVVAIGGSRSAAGDVQAHHTSGVSPFGGGATVSDTHKQVIRPVRSAGSVIGR